MSRYEWEHGTFKLPAAEFAAFRQKMQDTVRASKEREFDVTQRFWKGLTRKQQTDVTAYAEAVQQFESEMWRRGGLHGDNIDEATRNAAWRLKAKTYPRYEGTQRIDPDKPSRVLKEEMEYPTNRTTTFHGDDCTVDFDKDTKTVTWSVSENNHAVDGARNSPLGRAFFGHLEKVRWTHGTGGVLVGNDEYNRDDYSSGGGANYCTGAYGYLGIEQEPTRAQPFVNARGQRIKPEVKVGRYGFTGKAVVVGDGPDRGYSGPGTNTGSFRARHAPEQAGRL